MNIAIQGQSGSFHHEAALAIGPERSPGIVPCDSFREVFDTVSAGDASYGLVAIENNLHGAINEVYRLFREYPDAWIVRETRRHIGQNLIGHEQTELADLKSKGDELTVISHPVALEQVKGWMRTNLPDAVLREYRDTAGSVERVVKEANPSLVAVAGKIACETYGGEVIAEEIQDDSENHTRFVMFANGHEQVKDATDSSMILTTNHQPGALLKALNVFDLFACNLTKLDSHPRPGDKQHYDFYIDYEMPDDNQALIALMERQGFSIRNLGEYVRVQ